MTRRELRFRLVGWLGKLFLLGLGPTLRYRIEGWEEVEKLKGERNLPVIFACWHADILPLAYLHRNQGVIVLVSRHADGEYIARVLRGMGYGTGRGSSTRGGSRGLRELVGWARRGRDVAFTPDGPKGPPRVFKSGAAVAAKLSGLPVVPVRVDGPGVWRVGSWDRFKIPKPFGRLRVRYGPMYEVPRDGGAEDLEKHRQALEDLLNLDRDPEAWTTGPGVEAGELR